MCPSRKSGPRAPRLEPALDFLRLLWAIEHRLQRVSKRMEATHGITGPQRLVLRILLERPDLTARELSDVLHLHASTVTGILQRLEKKHLVIRTRDEDDNRRIKLRVHASVKSLIARPDGTIEAAIRPALASLAPARVRNAQATLAAIAEALENGQDDA